jgi:hypothetical protein
MIKIVSTIAEDRRRIAAATPYTASVFYVPEKPYGVGHNAHERACRIVGGWRGEIISGLADGVAVYTGVCRDKDAVKRELIDHLKALGLSGVLRFE